MKSLCAVSFMLNTPIIIYLASGVWSTVVQGDTYPHTICLSYNTDKISSDGRVMGKPYFMAVCKQQPGGVIPDFDDPNDCDFVPYQGTRRSS